MVIRAMRSVVLILAGCVLTLSGCAASIPQEQSWPSDPVFDIAAIVNDPLDAQVLSREEVDGIVFETVEYTAEVRYGETIRVQGILAYPVGGRDLPAVYWSQGGMYPADRYWPQVYARKGYFCLNVTLPHHVYDSFTRFNTETPREGNFAGLAVVQMRGITYMTQRPEVDADRVGVGGSSYGGLFATLIAGADPRVKAGFSFFTSGNHHLGTHYPQFLNLRITDEIGIWLGTIDPAWRLKRRPVPFLFAVAANDHWAHLPAAIQSYVDARGDKRLAIAPNWAHAFPENIDDMLIDWLDVYLTGTREPYNMPGEMTVRNEGGNLVASWPWTGKNAVTHAELIVSYGPVRPWHGWVHRYHHTISATVEGDRASAVVPVPETTLDVMLYGNVYDENGVVVTTTPITVRPAKHGITERTPEVKINAALVTEFSPEEMVLLQRHGTPVPGQADVEVKHTGSQSLRIGSNEAGARVNMKLGNVPERGHLLTVALRADRATKVRVAVLGARPANWQFPVVNHLRKQYSGSPDIEPADIRPPTFEAVFDVDDQWRVFTLDCPYDGMPVEGYDLHIQQAEGHGATYWIDSIEFTPQWRD